MKPSGASWRPRKMAQLKLSRMEASVLKIMENAKHTRGGSSGFVDAPERKAVRKLVENKLARITSEEKKKFGKRTLLEIEATILAAGERALVARDVSGAALPKKKAAKKTKKKAVKRASANPFPLWDAKQKKISSDLVRKLNTAERKRQKLEGDDFYFTKWSSVRGQTDILGEEENGEAKLYPIGRAQNILSLHTKIIAAAAKKPIPVARFDFIKRRVDNDGSYLATGTPPVADVRRLKRLGYIQEEPNFFIFDEDARTLPVATGRPATPKRTGKAPPKAARAPGKKAPKKAAKSTTSRPELQKSPPSYRSHIAVSQRPTLTASIRTQALHMLDSMKPARVRQLLGEERRRMIGIRRTGVKRVREECKVAKLKTRERLKIRRAKILLMWANNKRDELRRHDRTCADRKATIMATFERGSARTQALKAAMRDEKHQRAHLKRGHTSPARVKASMRAQETRSETIDRARHEVEAVSKNLLPYFEKVKGRLKKKKGISLAEQFFQMAHENPEAAMLSSQRKADLEIAALLEHGEPKWMQRAARVETAICKRATRAAKSGHLFQLKSSELKALQELNIDATRLVNECFNQQIPKRRIVSQRLAAAPF